MLHEKRSHVRRKSDFGIRSLSYQRCEPSPTRLAGGVNNVLITARLPAMCQQVCKTAHRHLLNPGLTIVTAQEMIHFLSDIVGQLGFRDQGWVAPPTIHIQGECMVAINLHSRKGYSLFP